VGVRFEYATKRDEVVMRELAHKTRQTGAWRALASRQ